MCLFSSFSTYSPNTVNHGLFHFRGHIMLQLRKVSHCEAFSGRIDPYIGYEVENETSKREILCEKNLWPRYAARIRLWALYTSIFHAVRLLSGGLSS